MSRPFDRNELENLLHAKLRARFVEMVGCAPRSPNKTWMINQMAEVARRSPGGDANGATVATNEPAVGAEPTPAPPPTSPMLEDAEEEAEGEADTDATPAVAPNAATSAAEADVSLSVEGRAEEDTDAPPASAVGGVDVPSPSSTCALDVLAVNESAEPAPVAVIPASPPSHARVITPENSGDANGEASPSPAIGVAPAAGARREPGRYRGMTVDELRRAYELVVGRPTSSVDAPYLRWKLIQAEKQRIPIGPLEPGRRREGSLAQADKTLPLTLSAGAVLALDTAWANKGFRSRMSFLRTAIREALLKRNESDAAAHFPERTSD